MNMNKLAMRQSSRWEESFIRFLKWRLKMDT